jgi:cobalamin biosynthesis protein CbiG
MNHDHYAQYIRRQLTAIQYDSGSASTNTHYQLGLLIGVIAQQAVQNNKIMDLVRAKLERNSRRR